MSVIVYSINELEQIASSIYRDYADHIDTYQDRQIAKQEANNKFEKRNDLDIRLDNYRWFFERIHIANQTEFLYDYGHYGQSKQISFDQINPLSQCKQLTRLEQLEKLKSLRYNSSQFLSKEDLEKLERLIDLINAEILRGIKN